VTGGPVVVALGDSITAGVGDVVAPDAPHGPGWAAHLATLCGAATFTNLASNGARARSVVAEQLDAALALDPDVVTLVAGGNDALRSDFSPVEVAGHLAVCVDVLRGRGATIVLATLPPIGLFELLPPRVRRVMRARVEAVNATVRVVARGLPVFAVGDALRAAGIGAWHVDRVHPSPLGHRHVAAAAYRRLARGGGGLDAATLDGRLPAAPAPPSAVARAAWLAVAGVPWAWRRGRDFLPGLVRAVVDDARGVPLDLPALSPALPAQATAEAFIPRS
jgi:lysophospholipase L1-like esterase